MNRKQDQTLKDIFSKPTPANINWSDIESLFIALGAEITPGKGSRVRVALNGIRAVFHRPHPEKETDKGAVLSVKKFLYEAGFEPSEKRK